MPMPTMKPVQSTNIASVGYDAESESLYITFLNSGRTYRYKDVPLGVYDDLVSAPSVGRFFADHIKGVYDEAAI